MCVDCVRRRFDTVFEANTHRCSREIFLKHFCNAALVIYDVIVFGKSYVISIFEFLVRKQWRNSFSDYFYLISLQNIYA